MLLSHSYINFMAKSLEDKIGDPELYREDIAESITGLEEAVVERIADLSRNLEVDVAETLENVAKLAAISRALLDAVMQTKEEAKSWRQLEKFGMGEESSPLRAKLERAQKIYGELYAELRDRIPAVDRGSLYRFMAELFSGDEARIAVALDHITILIGRCGEMNVGRALAIFKPYVEYLGIDMDRFMTGVLLKKAEFIFCEPDEAFSLKVVYDEKCGGLELEIAPREDSLWGNVSLGDLEPLLESGLFDSARFNSLNLRSFPGWAALTGHPSMRYIKRLSTNSVSEGILEFLEYVDDLEELAVEGKYLFKLLEAPAIVGLKRLFIRRNRLYLHDRVDDIDGRFIQLSKEGENLEVTIRDNLKIRRYRNGEVILEKI